MEPEKQTSSTTNPVPSSSEQDASPTHLQGHTAHDARDMRRMGKQQEFLRSFRIFTSIAFTSCVMGTWEILLTSNTSALIAGGLAGLWWQFIWCYVGQTFVVLSLSEMASMAPTAGGQYHWVSEFSPPKLQKLLSYTSGWLSTLAWQAFVTVDSYIVAFLLQSLIVLNHPHYSPQRWHATLLTIAAVLSMGGFNVLFSRALAKVEAFFAILHFLAWIPFVAVLWVYAAPKQPAHTVFTDFSDNGAGWGNLGLTVCVGQVGAMFTIVGSDAAAHMAEEISGAGVVVPRAMWWAYVANIPVALTVLAAYVFCIGDLATTLAATEVYPVVSVFEQAVGRKGATALTAGLLVLNYIIAASCMASTVRQTFAFARDDGMLFSRFLARVHPKYQVPANAVFFTAAFTSLLSLINIGSATAFNAFLSVAVVALMATYTLSIACVLHRRLRGDKPLPLARWRLWGANVDADVAAGQSTGGGLGRRAGPIINVCALIYSCWAFFWSFWPIYAHPTVENMNWAVVIFAGVMLIAAAAFLLRARKTYDGPVSKVKELEDE